MKKEVLWGTDEEINNYMFDLFEHLILEVFSDQNEYNLDIEKYLCDYIPYAKNSTYWEVIVKCRLKHRSVFLRSRQSSYRIQNRK